MYDYGQFGGVKEIDAAVDGYGALEKDGVYRIHFQNVSIDFFCGDLSRAYEVGIVLVCFGGAMSKRKNTAGPFFSGRGLQSRVNIPFIGISDPMLEKSDSLLLAWYLGCPKTRHLPNIIAYHLDGIAKNFGADLIMVGGSGGGFAILNVQQHLESKSRSLIWNPQTNVSKYRLPEISEYIKSVYGYTDEILTAEQAEATLISMKVQYDVTQACMKNGEAIYLQNASDKHVKEHMKPFMKNGKWEDLGEKVYKSENRKIYIALTNWGKGHAAMPKDEITSALKSLKAGVPSLEIIRAIQAAHPLTAKT